MNQVERGLSVALAASLLSNAPRVGLRLGSALYTAVVCSVSGRTAGAHTLTLTTMMYSAAHSTQSTARSLGDNTMMLPVV